MKVVVVGAGPAGLAAGLEVLRLRPDAELSVLEESGRAGGLVRTERTSDGFLMEHGPESFLRDKPAGLEMVRRLGIEPRAIGTTPLAGPSRPYVLHEGRLVPVPEGFGLVGPTRVGPLLRSSLFSWPGKLRMLAEPLVPRKRDDSDESLADFVRRRFGRECFERLAQPLAGGIYAGDSERLSIAAALPRYPEMEAKTRSLALGLRRAARAQGAASAGVRYGLFVSFDEGMQVLTDAMANALGPRLRLSTGARALTPVEGARWLVDLSTGEGVDADVVIVALPAPAASRLLRAAAPAVSAELALIRYSSCGSVTMAVPLRDIDHPLDAYGFVVPALERSPLLACTFTSAKFAGRAPPEMALLRVFLGGAANRVLDVDVESDDALVEVSQRELRTLLGIRRDPLWARVDRWRRSMPQYEIGHRERVARIEAGVAAVEGIAVAGNAYRGVGIPDAIASGWAAARSVLVKA